MALDQLTPKMIVPVLDKVLAEIIPDDKYSGIVALPDVMQHSGDKMDYSAFAKNKRPKDADSRFQYHHTDTPMKVKILKKGPDIKCALSIGDVTYIKRDFKPDFAATFKHANKEYIIFPADEKFIIGVKDKN